MSSSPSNSVSRRAFLASGASAATLMCLPARLFAQYEAGADADNPVVLRFSALSDVHFKVSPQAQEVDRFRRAMKFMYDYSAEQSYQNFDAMLVAGDVSDHGWDDELLLFKKVMDEGIKQGTETILCMGNHEFIAGTKPRWEEIFERDSNKTYDVNGFKFIALSPERGSCGNGDFLYAMSWYRKELEKANAADPDKPIFTFQHYHITPTVYGSRGEDNWGTVDLYEILQRYPRVINFSGHSHYPINDPRSAWQGNFTAFGTGTLSYFEMGGEGGKYNKFPQGYTNAAQMYVVEVRKDNSVTLKPYDLISNSFFDLVYHIAQPGAVKDYLYTDERYLTSSKPEWPVDAKLDAPEVLDEETVKLSFKQATCKDVVHSYRVELTKKVVEADQTSWEGAGARYFWSEYYFKPQPETMNAVVEELEPTTTYRARVVALSPFFKESEKALETEFTTPKAEVENVDRTAQKPEANFLNVQFVDGKPVNSAKFGQAIQDFGAVVIDKDASLGGTDVATFNGRDQFLKVQFASRDYRKIKAEGTFAVKFQFDKFPETISDPFANTQGTGVSYELNGKDKTLQFWVSVDGQYVVVSVPIEPKKEYYDAFGTYDGQDVVLYLDGKEVARTHKPGRMTHPTNESEQAFCIGSDLGGGGCGEFYFAGKIASARIFTWALSAEQIANLHE
ncbi:MAG: metallophosphoesterase [Thermoguttaceae bacterium]|nr:metallophosphoesterase [Thermoguttaceae bacterium]